MINGLYQSATGVLINSYRQDVIANNLANAETVGFKKDLALFRARPTEARARGLPPGASDPLMEALGGGIFAMPTRVDMTQGELEPSSNPLDLALEGHGFFAVEDAGQMRLTRNGQFMLDSTGSLILANGKGQRVLDDAGKTINLNPRQAATFDGQGRIFQGGKVAGRLGVYDVNDPSQLSKVGGTLLAASDPKQIVTGTAVVRDHSIERANVDPATELTVLLDAQRQLEANANMIRYQDQTLAKLVNEVGKIG